MGWLNKDVNLGIVQENEKVIFQYKYQGNIKDIKNLTPSCGSCTEIIKVEDSGVITVKFKSGSIPIHLKGEDLPFRKRIAVTYSNGDESENLYFFGVLSEQE